MAKILIVEDDSNQREMYKQVFEFQDYEVVEAPDVNKAAQIAKDEPFDAILLDLLFPNADGIHLIKEARSVNSKNINTPIIVLTNLDYGEKTKKALELGANTCLFKTQHTPKSIFKEVQNFIGNDSSEKTQN